MNSLSDIERVLRVVALALVCMALAKYTGLWR